MTERAPIPQPEPAHTPLSCDRANDADSFETIRIPAGEGVQLFIVAAGEVTILINRMSEPRAGQLMTTDLAPVEPAPTESPMETPSPAPTSSAETVKTPEQERVDVRGYIATDPKFRERKEGKKTLKFVLAEHPDTTTTTFHNVTVWNERADKLNGTLAKGEEVHVVGRLREFSYTDRKTGERKTSHEIYAFGVGKSKKKDTMPPAAAGDPQPAS